MSQENTVVRSGDMMLTSPHATPYPFSIVIKNAWPLNHAACAFEIKGADPRTSVMKTCNYALHTREHRAYLDLFEKLTNDFGLQLPENRKPSKTTAFSTAYREVLNENLAGGMFYGYGDPAVLQITDEMDKANSGYLLVATSNDAPDAFPILRSRDLINWDFSGYIFPSGETPEWASVGEGKSDYWAPELHWVNNEFRLYFVAREERTLELCIGVARSAKATGPFVADREPILKGNIIDPHVFVESDQKAYLYWKEDNNDVWPRLFLDLLHEHPRFIGTLFLQKEEQVTASFVTTLWPWARMLEPMERFQAIQIFIETVIANYTHFYERLQTFSTQQSNELQDRISSILHYMKTPMYAQQLTPDGSSLTGERYKVLENDLDWEAHLVEGMWVTKQNERYFLFYAGNDFSTSQYGIGAAVGSSPVGPFQKMEKQLLQSTAEWWAPGHPSLVVNPKGQRELFLHAYSPGKAGYKQFRALLSVIVDFHENGVALRQP